MLNLQKKVHDSEMSPDEWWAALSGTQGFVCVFLSVDFSFTFIRWLLIKCDPVKFLFFIPGVCLHISSLTMSLNRIENISNSSLMVGKFIQQLFKVFPHQTRSDRFHYI